MLANGSWVYRGINTQSWRSVVLHTPLGRVMKNLSELERKKHTDETVEEERLIALGLKYKCCILFLCYKHSQDDNPLRRTTTLTDVQNFSDVRKLEWLRTSGGRPKEVKKCTYALQLNVLKVWKPVAATQEQVKLIIFTFNMKNSWI